MILYFVNQSSVKTLFIQSSSFYYSSIRGRYENYELKKEFLFRNHIKNISSEYSIIQIISHTSDK